jgi:hypothetical protein
MTPGTAHTSDATPARAVRLRQEYSHSGPDHGDRGLVKRLHHLHPDVCVGKLSGGLSMTLSLSSPAIPNQVQDVGTDARSFGEDEGRRSSRAHILSGTPHVYRRV